MSKKINPINGKYYCLVAPDGNLQFSTLCSTVASCMGFIKLLHSRGVSESLDDLVASGYTIEEVDVTIKKSST